MKWNLFFTILLVTGTAMATEISPMVKLNRLSRVIRGYAPTDTDREEMKEAIRKNQGDSLLKSKVDEYLASEAHARKMNVRLEELFRLPTTQAIAGVDEDSQTAFQKENALNFLFSEIARKNQSWDTLLTGKSYRLFNTGRFAGFGIADYGFMAAILPDLKASTGVYQAGEAKDPKKTDVTFDDTDSRIAGSITTNRFFTRYSNTGLNKNRKRAAAIFRIFLCDSMSAAVASSQGQDDLILDMMFPHDNSMSETDLKSMPQGDALHGKRADCMACHSKLDPMGKTLLTSPLVLSPFPTPGKLTYKRGQELVDVPVRGVGDLGKAIVKQPEYVHCQVEHFWNWFMDEKTALTPAKKKALATEFERVGRRTNDFIKVLLSQPEFFEIAPPMTEAELRAKQVKTFFKRCQDCHKDQYSDDGDIPDFTQWPIAGSKEEAVKWIAKISRAMDLPHDGEKPRMPPTEAAWRSNFQQIQLIKKWIADGAPNEKGERMFDK